MYTWKQESLGLRSLLAYPDRSRQVEFVQAEGDLTAAQAEKLLETVEGRKEKKRGETRTFYAVAISAGHELSAWTMAFNAVAAAACMWFGLFMLYQGHTFVSIASFGLMAFMMVVFKASYTQYRNFSSHDGVVEGEIDATHSAPAGSDQQAA